MTLIFVGVAGPSSRTGNGSAIVVANPTAVTEPSPWPVIVTTVPAGPEVGDIPVTFVVAKLSFDTAFPPGVVKVTVPSEKFAGTVVTICVGEVTLNSGCATLPNTSVSSTDV